MYRNSSLVVWLVLGSISGTGSIWAAVPGTVATFDVNEDGFAGSTTATVQTHAVNGGNPDGHVLIRKDLEPGFDIGTQNSTWPEFLGDYAAAGITGAGFDLNVFNTAFDELHFRLRRDVFENGWYYDFGAALPNANLWESYDVIFDPTWSDAIALANGWAQEAGSPSFAAVLGSVGWVEVRTINEGSAIAGVDNVRIVPEPGTLAFLVVGIAIIRRRSTRRGQ